jgi:hypothetical protein
LWMRDQWALDSKIAFRDLIRLGPISIEMLPVV